MPSVLLTAASGGPWPLVSGNYFSGQGANHPVGGMQLYLDVAASGNAYVGLSGGATVNSGGFLLSGINVDAMPIRPGGGYFLPKLAFISGQLNVFVTCDPTCSGVARLYYEIF